MNKWFSKMFFDRRDHALLNIVNQVLDRDRDQDSIQRIFYPYFHPRGIKELAEPKGLRLAYAMARLLNSLEVGRMDERLDSLRTLVNEVQNVGMGPLPKNTARVLLQIMKDLIRSRGDYETQLRLAHDFRLAAFGKPAIVRKNLASHHLLEMPEEWNQLAFDDHVHDAYTKGRKSSTHLIMDAWIKGIRRLRVIYYNHVEPKVIAELLEAARIMGVNVRVGVEFSALFRNRYIHLIWTPRGFSDSQDFLCFLAEEHVARFMDEGRQASRFEQQYVLRVFEAFNTLHRPALNRELGINLPPLDREGFFRFVGEGQMSVLHLATYVHRRLLPLLRERLETLRTEFETAEEAEKVQIQGLVEAMDRLLPAAIADKYLDPDANPEIPDPAKPSPEAPEFLRQTPGEVVRRLAALRAGYRITLNLSGLAEEDVLEILYKCEGEVTRLEVFNLKDWVDGKGGPILAISELQHAINTGNVIILKTRIQQIINKVRLADPPDRDDRVEKLEEILHDIETFQAWYANTALKARMGSDSTGRMPKMFGMGLAITDTLPPRARKEVARGKGWMVIPMGIQAFRRISYLPGESSAHGTRNGGKKPFHERFVRKNALAEWDVVDKSTGMYEEGNIVCLGGLNVEPGNGLSLSPAPALEQKPSFGLRYLNTPLKYFLKVLIGFIPAFLTFLLTKDWWVLAYLGAVIWFGATGLRNILQSVLGGGGLRRSPLLKWNDFVSWERITDSLLYTGFSVPLLDFGVKTLLCGKLLGITTATDPIALYTILAIVNGLYISGHNLVRGLPRGAVIGNLFRTVLSIPLAYGLNLAAGSVLASSGAVDVDGILQKWAAIISKFASDSVAGIIEGTADRFMNLKIRGRDYRDKFRQLMMIYSQLSILAPDETMEDLMDHRKGMKNANVEARDLEKLLFINALDMLYFWMYQPRARIALRAYANQMSPDEQRLLVSAQGFLERKKEISRLFIDGLVGENFSRALSFYLDQSPEYLKDVRKLAYAET